MKLIHTISLVCLIMVTCALAMDQEEQAIFNSGQFAVMPLEVLRLVAGAMEPDPECQCDCCGDSILDWKDINAVQSTCKHLRQYFIPDGRDILVDFSTKRQETETVEAFLNRVLVHMLKCKMYPHEKPIILKLNENRLSEDLATVARFFKNIDTLGLSKRIIDLQLADNNLTSIADNIVLCNKLGYLDLANNQLSTGDVAKLCTISTLMDLNLSHNNLHQLPDTLGMLVNLEYLQIDNNDLFQLPDSIRSLAKLHQINLSSNHLSSREIDKVCALELIDDVNLFNNPITELPNSINTRKDLDTHSLTVLSLDVSQLPMTEIAKICRLSQLTDLVLYEYNQATLPVEISNLKKLTSLWIYGNNGPVVLQGSELAKLAKFDNLQSLAFLNIHIAVLPEEILRLPHLSSLTLVHIELPIDELTKIGDCSNLVSLDLSANGLIRLPNSISRLQKLKILELEANNLPVEEIAKVGTLANLEILRLNFNNLASLPPQLSQLKKLKRLDVSSNPIEQDDEAFAQLFSQLPKNLEIIGLPEA